MTDVSSDTPYSKTEYEKMVILAKVKEIRNQWVKLSFVDKVDFEYLLDLVDRLLAED